MNRTLLIALFVTSISHAQWSTDPANNLIVGYGITPEIASDSNGGCYITYIQQVGIYDRILLERLNRYGYKPWGPYKQIVGALPGQTFAEITEDGFGGVIVSFVDVELVSPKEPPIQRLRVQRVDSSGNFLWGPNGMRVSVSETNQGDQAIVPDGYGGCVVAWKDTLSTIRLQRVDDLGTRAWGDSGLLVTATQYTPRLVTTSSNSFIIAFGTLLKQYSLSGDPGWGGQPVNVGFGTRTITAARDGGVIVYDGTGTSSNILIVTQKVDSSGDFAWNSPYVLLADSAIFNVLGNPISLTATGGATFAWRKTVGGVGDLRMQIVRSDGSTFFQFGGRPVSRVLSQKGPVGILPSDSSTSLFVWGDSRTPGGIYAQRVDTLAESFWDTNDVLLNIPQFGEMKVTTDGSGGCIGVGFHQFDFSIRALQVSRNGLLGKVITSAENEIRLDLPIQPILFQNYPNPFNPQTTIRFQLPHSAPIVLTLHNILGQRIRTLDSGIRSAGIHNAILEANHLPSGTYFYRLTTPQAVLTHKLLIIK